MAMDEYNPQREAVEAHEKRHVELLVLFRMRAQAMINDAATIALGVPGGVEIDEFVQWARSAYQNALVDYRMNIHHELRRRKEALGERPEDSFSVATSEGSKDPA